MGAPNKPTRDLNGGSPQPVQGAPATSVRKSATKPAIKSAAKTPAQPQARGATPVPHHTPAPEQKRAAPQLQELHKSRVLPFAEPPVPVHIETMPLPLPSVADVAPMAVDAQPHEAPAAAPKPKAAPHVEEPTLGSIPIPNFEAMSINMGRLVEQAGKAMVAYAKPIEEGRPAGSGMGDQMSDAVKTLGHVAEYWLSDSGRALEVQSQLSSSFISLWANTLKRFTGEETEPVVPPDPADKRFNNPEWRTNPFFDFLRQAYSISSKWANDLVDKAELDPHERQKAQFYIRQLSGALSPTNFLATNPELIRETLRTSGENLVRGMHMFAEDVEAGNGQLRIRQSDNSRFELGVDMATTPGKVVFRNDLIELIQYNPTTPDVYRRPLLIVPPWINKFYVLDLNPEKSFIRWAVSQGLTVFVISWVNPDARHADKDFEAYMREGIFAACEAMEAATGERQVTAIGYCVGGTLLAVTLAYMAAMKDDRIASVTFFTTQVDFKDSGDLKVFVDEARIASMEEKMQQTGYLDGVEMASAFNMLRPNELIWSYFVNNYLKGKEPMPFDLLTWNSDSTRMPAANHSFYLRNCYLDDKLAKGEMEIAGETLNLKNVTVPVYNLAAREDHIAPAVSVFNGAKLFGGPMRYVLAGSGHIAGVVNPASKPKYQYWTGDVPSGTFEDWVATAKETKGTWWLDWIEWISSQAPDKVPARTPGDGKLTPICDAPGEYVRVKS